MKWSESHLVMSDSLQPHGLYSPWNSSGQNTGVGSLSLLQGIFPTQGLNPGLPHWRQIFLSVEPQGKPKNTEVGCHALLKWIFPTQGLNPGLPHCRQILYPLNHQGSPVFLKRVANPFYRGSFWPRNRSGVSYIEGRFFISWVTREGPGDLEYMENTLDFIMCVTRSH